MNIHEVICQNKLLSANDDSCHKHTILRGGGKSDLVDKRITHLDRKTGNGRWLENGPAETRSKQDKGVGMYGKKCQRKLAAIYTRRKKNTQGIDTTLKYLTEVLIPFKSENKFQQKFL